MPTDLIPTVPHPCGCRTSGIDDYRYPCPSHREGAHSIGEPAPPDWPGPVTCDDLVAVACDACGTPFLRTYSAVRPTQCTGCDEIDRIEA